MHPNKLMELDIRLGYKDIISLTRNELKELVDGNDAQLQKLRNEIDSLEEDRGELQDDIDDLESVIEDLQEKNEKLNKEIEELKKELKYV